MREGNPAEPHDQGQGNPLPLVQVSRSRTKIIAQHRPKQREAADLVAEAECGDLLLKNRDASSCNAGNYSIPSDKAGTTTPYPSLARQAWTPLPSSATMRPRDPPP